MLIRPRHASLAFSAGIIAAGLLPPVRLNVAPMNRQNQAVRPRWNSARGRTGAMQLYVNQRPFYIKGAGIEFGSQEKLKEHGGNSFRTWTTDNGRDTGQQVLDRAFTNGLYVAMGLDVDHERRGFDYNNTNTVARQFAQLISQVLEYRRPSGACSSGSSAMN